MPKKITTPLDQRVCKRGHVGQYRKRGARTLACYECQKLAIAKFKVSGKIGRTRLPLEKRVCKQGHVGQYSRAKDGSAFCKPCGVEARIRFLSRNDVDVLKYERQLLLVELARVEALITKHESGE